MTERRDITGDGTVEDSDPRLPAELEKALKERARADSDLPWMAMRVQHQIEARERARAWLRERRATSARDVWRLGWGLLAVPRLWTVIGAALAGGVAGYFAGLHLPPMGFETVPTLAIPAAMIGAALTVFGALWPSVREFYT